MRKLALLSSILLTLAACNQQKSTSGEDTENQTEIEQQAIGGEKDDHGCLVAAGESWSELKQGCIQVFNEGQRLNPIEVQQGDAEISAFILFNDDKSKVEIFTSGDDKTSTVLQKGEADVYQNEVYKYDNTESVLYVNGEKKYELAK